MSKFRAHKNDVFCVFINCSQEQFSKTWTKHIIVIQLILWGLEVNDHLFIPSQCVSPTKLPTTQGYVPVILVGLLGPTF